MISTTLFVGAVVQRGSDVLLVRQSVGHDLEGQWTIPWGRIEPGETPSDAAVRETWEEGGIRAKVVGLLGVQELPAPQLGGIALVYFCEHASGDPHPQDAEIDAARYFSQRDLDALAEPLEPWSSWLVRRIFGGAFTVTYSDATNPLRADGAFL